MPFRRASSPLRVNLIFGMHRRTLRVALVTLIYATGSNRLFLWRIEQNWL